MPPVSQLDNWLVIFQALVKSNKVNLADLPESGHIIERALQMIDNGQYGDAKLLILQSVTPQPQVVSGTLDLYGNEGDFFLKLLRPYLMSTTTTTCCSNNCPSQVHTVTSLSVTLPQPNNHNNEDPFFASLDGWLYPQDSQCGRKFSTKPSEEISFYEDATLDENGDAHMSWHCAGIRVSTPRVMLNLKSFVIFSVDLLSRGGLPLSISLFGRNLNLCGATLGMVGITFAFSISAMAGTCMTG